jgi:hypothetical protein
MAKNLAGFFEAERLKKLGSRQNFPITSIVQIVEARWGLESKSDDYLNQIVLRNIVLPYLLYGEVVVEDLNKFRENNLQSIKLFNYAQQKHLCVDLDEYYPKFRSTNVRDPNEYADFNSKFLMVDSLKCGLMAELVRRRKRITLSRPYQARVEAIAEISGLAGGREPRDFNECLQAVSSKLGLRMYDSVAPETIKFVTELHDSDLLTICGNAARMVANFHLQALRFQMRELGVNAIPVHFDDAKELFGSRQSESSMEAQSTIRAIAESW